jgi:hypothetical protein
MLPQINSNNFLKYHEKIDLWISFFAKNEIM